MIPQDLNWDKDSLIIFYDEGNFSCSVFDEPENGVIVSKFSDIIFRTDEFQSTVCKYFYDEIITDILNSKNASDIIQIFNNNILNVFDYASVTNNFLKLIFQDRMFIDINDYTKSELNILSPIAKILKNLNSNFFDDYYNSQKVNIPDKIYFPVKNKYYEIDKQDEIGSYLILKKNDDNVCVNLHIAKGIDFYCIGPNCYSCLAKISKNLTKFSNHEDLKTDENQNRFVTVSNEKFLQKAQNICTVGLSEEVSEFREQIYGPDGKGF